MDDAGPKRLARAALIDKAQRARANGMSALSWEDSVAETPEGILLGEKEVSAIGSLVFTGKKLR
jgi:hypothetical protein